MIAFLHQNLRKENAVVYIQCTSWLHLLVLFWPHKSLEEFFFFKDVNVKENILEVFQPKLFRKCSTVGVYMYMSMFWCNLVFVRERDGELWNRCSWELLICIRPTLFVNLMNVRGVTCANSLPPGVSPTPPLDAKEKILAGDTLCWPCEARIVF